MYFRTFILTSALLAAGAAYAGEAEGQCRLGPLKYKQNAAKLIDCPSEAQLLIDRAINCQHWTGEDPYDEARGHEIETALTELKCDTLSLDHDRLLKKYRSERAVIEAIQGADREYNLEF